MISSMFALWAAAALAGGPVTGVSVSPAAERTQILIAVDGDVEYRHFTMEGPNRLVVDIVGSRLALPRQDYPAINRGGVLALRTSQYSAEVVRVVLELDALVPYDIDEAEGVMPDDVRPMRITEIALRPRITVRGAVAEDRVRHLCEVAHRECYIANSLRTEIIVEPEFAFS